MCTLYFFCIFKYVHITFTSHLMHKPLLFSPEDQPPHEGWPFKGQQIPAIRHQVVINVIHSWRIGWIEEIGVFVRGGKQNFMLPCFAHSAFNSLCVRWISHQGERSSITWASAPVLTWTRTPACQQWVPSSRSSSEVSEHTQPHPGTAHPWPLPPWPLQTPAKQTALGKADLAGRREINDIICATEMWK